jgi:hypothetical protein
MDKDPDPGGPKTCGSGSPTLEKSIEISCFKVLDVFLWGLEAYPGA